MPAQSSTDFLTNTPRLGEKEEQSLMDFIIQALAWGK
jgi:hypothetical protein